MSYDDSYMSCLPTEVLQFIFTSIPARELIVCRRVCSRWKQIVDGMTRSDALWRLHCRQDFKNIYKMARIKARPNVLWFHIYRSLSLWPKLSLAREHIDEFAAGSGISEEIQNFTILSDGLIGVHKKGAIVYYDIDTLKKSKRTSIIGDYLKYTENDDFIVLLSDHYHLFIIRKATQNPKYETNITFDNVKSFILVKKKIFYVKLNDEIFECQLDDTDLRHQLVIRSNGAVMCLGYTDRLHVLTLKCAIYTVRDDEMLFICGLGVDTNLFHQLCEYNFLEHLDWRVYMYRIDFLQHIILKVPLRAIVAIRIYGHFAFVGYYWGMLRIYYAPYIDGELDIFNSEPVKQYDFMERDDCKIIQIDVMEGEAGHTVIVAMPKKIAVLEFTHNFERTVSVAMQPYNDVQKVKVLKIEESQ